MRRTNHARKISLYEDRIQPETMKRDVMRNVVLASVLEPLGEKTDCTTRQEDYQTSSKLEYFITAGCNIGWDFYDLVDRIEKERKQPPCIFDTAYKAQLSSLRNRRGRRINFGIIQLLVPVVTSQMILGSREPEEIADYTTEVMKNTTEQDVSAMDDLMRLHFSLTDDPNEASFKPFYGRFDNLYDVLETLIDEGLGPRQVHEEMIHGNAYSMRFFRGMERNIERSVIETSAEEYSKVYRKEINNQGVAADFVAIALYLMLTKYEKEKII